MPYQSTKTYGAERGLSACFRQWRADSHCRFLHGYALGFKLTFEAGTLDDRNWVVDFGSLKEVKQFLDDTFDHKLLIAEDDPFILTLQALGFESRGEDSKLAQVVLLPAVGCEAFAEYVADYVKWWLRGQQGSGKRVRLIAVECFEHEGNSASWIA